MHRPKTPILHKESIGRAPKQLALIRARDLGRTEHGGDLRQGLRKEHRPFSPDAAIHVVLKSDRARGAWSLLHRRNRSKVEQLIHRHAAKSGVRVYRDAILGNHLHLLVKAPNKPAFQLFLRTITGLIARHVTQAKKGRSIRAILKSEGLSLKPKGPATHSNRAMSQAPARFWSSIPFTRLVHWGREYIALKAYLGKNRLEAVGFAGAKVRLITEESTGSSAKSGTPRRRSKPGRQVAVVVIGAPDFRPGRDSPQSALLRVHLQWNHSKLEPIQA